MSSTGDVVGGRRLLRVLAFTAVFAGSVALGVGLVMVLANAIPDEPSTVVPIELVPIPRAAAATTTPPSTVTPTTSTTPATTIVSPTAPPPPTTTTPTTRSRRQSDAAGCHRTTSTAGPSHRRR